MINKARLLNGLNWISENIPDNAEATYVLEQLVELINRYECFHCKAFLPREFTQSPTFDTAGGSIDHRKYLMAEINAQFEQKLPDVLSYKDIPYFDVDGRGPGIKASLEVLLPKDSDTMPKSPKIFHCLDAIEYRKEFSKDE